jgi:hypothetical protein
MSNVDLEQSELAVTGTCSNAPLQLAVAANPSFGHAQQHFVGMPDLLRDCSRRCSARCSGHKENG